MDSTRGVNPNPSWEIYPLIILITTIANPKMINIIHTKPRIAITKKERIEPQTWIKHNKDRQTIFNNEKRATKES